MPGAIEVSAESYSPSFEDEAHYDGTRLWFWTGEGAVTWDPKTDDWNEVVAFDGVWRYNYPFVRMIAGHLIVWGDFNADDELTDSPAAGLEGFVYRDDGWEVTAAAPEELYHSFWGLIDDGVRMYVLTVNSSYDPLRVGIYDVQGDEWQYSETPFEARQISSLLAFDSQHPWAALEDRLVIAGNSDDLWILNADTLEWSNVSFDVRGDPLRWLTVADDRGTCQTRQNSAWTPSRFVLSTSLRVCSANQGRRAIGLCLPLWRLPPPQRSLGTSTTRQRTRSKRWGVAVSRPACPRQTESSS